MTHAHDIEANAATWLARRDGGLSAAEEGEFTAWLAQDPRHRAAYLRLATAWERSARLTRLRPPDGAIDPDLLSPRRTPDLFRRWPRPMAVAASLVVVAIGATWWLLEPGGTRSYRTDVGGLSRVVLKDGSTVTLNTDTELRVQFTEEMRKVQLLRGEAQFHVAHDMRHPFEVEAAGRIVRAVGTAFDVRLNSPESLEVMVTEGKVALVGSDSPAGSGGTEAPTVSAGESAIAIDHHVTVRPLAATEASRRLAWEQGELSFQGETLAEAVEEFNRYNRKKLKVDDPSISQLAIGGNFQALDVESFVVALDRSFGIHSKIESDGTVVLERSAPPAE